MGISLRYQPSTNVKIALTRVPEVRRQVRRAAAAVRDEARRLAPKDTGAGARSIKVKSAFVNGQNEYHVSWDRDHFYMWFWEAGTIRNSPRPFLRPAADTVQRGGGSAPADPGE